MKARMQKWKEENKTPNIDNPENFRIESIKREQEKIRIEAIRQLLEKIPPRFRHKEFTDYATIFPEQARIKLICERFIATFQERLEQGSNAMFLGNPGTGKTLLSFIMYRAIVQKGFNVHYEPSLNFLKTLQEKRFKSPADFKAQIEHYKRAQILILDEVTESMNKTGCPSEHDKKLLFEVINARYEIAKCCTIIISNRDKKELTQRLGQPITDRLSENGMTLIFSWPSYRQKNKE